jgi:site-specific recombinase XerD
MVEWQSAVERLEGAYSPHTLRSYRTDFSCFAEWCFAKGETPLPAPPALVARYLDSEASRLKPSTLKRRLCGIRKIHRLHGHPDPTDDLEVDLAFRRVRRLKPSRPDQAFGVTAELRDRLLGACGDDLMGLRDRVAIAVGFDTLCRRGELVAISVEDMTADETGRYTVLVRRAKNDPDGAGRTARLSSRASALVREWLEHTGIISGPLLRAVYQGHVQEHYLQPITVARILKKVAGRVDLEEEKRRKVRGHSLRVGGAQQLTLNGHGLLVVMRAGGWKSMNVVARYVEHLDIDVWG